MQRYFCVIDESLKKFTNQIQIERAGRGTHKWNLKFQIRASREIDHDSGQGFIKRNVSMAVTADTALVADGLCQSLSDGDTDILNRVMGVDLQIAISLDFEVDQTMSGDLVQHVIEKWDAGREFLPAGAVQIDNDPDFRFIRIPDDFCCSGC